MTGTENSVETRLHQIEEELGHLASSIEKRMESSAEKTDARLSNLEQKLEAVTTKLAQLEGAIMVLGRNNSSGQRPKNRSYSNQYYPRVPPQLQPFQAENLALRLVTDVATLRDKRETLTDQEFVRWCKDRDQARYGLAL
uniref:hypothetical protein n=1 Tax=Hassallia byssoidea TaxID=482630 RepID=UPI001F40F473|nr:hypothetical protein [Hassalia byssoidea]